MENIETANAEDTATQLAALKPEDMPSNESIHAALATTASLKGHNDVYRVLMEMDSNQQLQLAVINLAREYDKIIAENPLGENAVLLKQAAAAWMDNAPGIELQQRVRRSTTASRREEEYQRAQRRIAAEAPPEVNPRVKTMADLPYLIAQALHNPNWRDPRFAQA